MNIQDDDNILEWRSNLKLDYIWWWWWWWRQRRRELYRSKCLMPMNCSYPVCFLFFNQLHLNFPFHRQSNIRNKKKNLEIIIITRLLVQLQYPVICAYHTILSKSLIFFHFRLNCSLCLSRCTSSVMCFLI
jgi:hypothetical protein